MFFFSFQLQDTHALFGVQLLMEFYTKNKYKMPFSSNNQDPQMNNICSSNNFFAKPTYNIETKTNNITLAVNPKLNVKQF
jgi:hypothetical protein